MMRGAAQVDHPSEQELERFFRGGLPAARRKAIVRHLRTECPQCREVIARVRQITEPQPRPARTQPQGQIRRRARRRWRRRKAARNVLEAEAQALLHEAAGDLEEIRKRLQDLVKGLPLSPQELEETDLDDEPDVTSEIRRVVRSVLNESLRPAIGDLLAAADYQPEVPQEATPPRLPDLAGVRMDISESDALFGGSCEDDPADDVRAQPPRREGR